MCRYMYFETILWMYIEFPLWYINQYTLTLISQIMKITWTQYVVKYIISLLFMWNSTWTINLNKYIRYACTDICLYIFSQDIKIKTAWEKKTHITHEIMMLNAKQNKNKLKLKPKQWNKQDRTSIIPSYSSVNQNKQSKHLILKQ